MDRERLPAVPRVQRGSLRGLLATVVRRSQGAEGRLVGDARAADPPGVPELLQARSPRRVRRLPHLRAMKIRLVTPAPRGSRAGNRITARRWATLLRSLGHEVKVESEYRGGAADVLIALHARKSHASVLRYRATHPEGKLVVALTGTDLYGDLGRSAAAHRSLE